MRRLIFSRQARRDLDGIREYIAGDSPAAARRTTDTMIEACLQLLDFPDIGRRGAKSGTRELVTVRPYVVVYRVSPEAVRIVRIRHGAENR